MSHNLKQNVWLDDSDYSSDSDTTDFELNDDTRSQHSFDSRRAFSKLFPGQDLSHVWKSDSDSNNDSNDDSNDDSDNDNNSDDNSDNDSNNDSDINSDHADDSATEAAELLQNRRLTRVIKMQEESMANEPAMKALVATLLTSIETDTRIIGTMQRHQVITENQFLRLSKLYVTVNTQLHESKAENNKIRAASQTACQALCQSSATREQELAKRINQQKKSTKLASRFYKATAKSRSVLHKRCAKLQSNLEHIQDQSEDDKATIKRQEVQIQWLKAELGESNRKTNFSELQLSNLRKEHYNASQHIDYLDKCLDESESKRECLQATISDFEEQIDQKLLALSQGATVGTTAPNDRAVEEEGTDEEETEEDGGLEVEEVEEEGKRILTVRNWHPTDTLPEEEADDDDTAANDASKQEHVQSYEQDQAEAEEEEEEEEENAQDSASQNVHFAAYGDDTDTEDGAFVSLSPSDSFSEISSVCSGDVPNGRVPLA